MFGISPIVPAFGRDYTSVKALEEDFNKGMDFKTPGGQAVKGKFITENGIYQIHHDWSLTLIQGNKRSTK